MFQAIMALWQSTRTSQMLKMPLLGSNINHNNDNMTITTVLLTQTRVLDPRHPHSLEHLLSREPWQTKINNYLFGLVKIHAVPELRLLPLADHQWVQKWIKPNRCKHRRKSRPEIQMSTQLISVPFIYSSLLRGMMNFTKIWWMNPHHSVGFVTIAMHASPGDLPRESLNIQLNHCSSLWWRCPAVSGAGGSVAGRIARCRANVFFEKLRCTYHTSTSMNQSLSMVKNPAVATMRKGFLSCACCMVPPARQQTMLTVSCVKHEARGASQSSMPSSYPITAWNVAMSAFKSGSVKTSRWMGGLLMCLWIPVESNRIKLGNGKNTITLSVPPTKIKMSRLHHEWMTKHTQFFIQFYVYKPPQQVWIGCPYISKHLLLNLLFFCGAEPLPIQPPKNLTWKRASLKKNTAVSCWVSILPSM